MTFPGLVELDELIIVDATIGVPRYAIQVPVPYRLSSEGRSRQGWRSINPLSADRFELETAHHDLEIFQRQHARWCNIVVTDCRLTYEAARVNDEPRRS